MTDRRFSYFVILAGMRTGSNLLERTLNSVEGVSCHGELFNPVFIGRPKFDECFGLSKKDRDSAPLTLISALTKDGGAFPGYRHFDGHDTRALDHVLSDPSCAKIVLTRNPVDSYVSLKLARNSGQWMLTTHNNKSASTQIEFDSGEYSDFVTARSNFLAHIRKALQASGQTAFEITYEELQDVEVLSGLIKFFGLEDRTISPDATLKKQNTSELRDKVSNFDVLQQTVVDNALTALDSPRLVDSPRGPAVRSFVAAPESGLIYLPVPGGPNAEIEGWLSRIEMNAGGTLVREMTRKKLRDLRFASSELLTFTVLRHPVLRAFATFCYHSTPGSDGYRPDLQVLLESRFGLGAKKEDDPNVVRRRTFLSYLRLLKATLAGQSGLGTPPPWRSQLSVLQGVGQLTMPDLILREEHISTDLRRFCSLDEHWEVPDLNPDLRTRLNEFYDGSVEKLARSIYGRDYSAFGFGEWTGGS